MASQRRLALEIDGLSVRYPGTDRDALDDVSIALAPGSYLSVAGRNGAGKSTLALAATGALPRVVRATTRGDVTVAGVPAISGGRAAGIVPAGLVLADPAAGLTGARATVREEVAFGLENQGVPRSEMDPAIDLALDALGIAHLADRPPETLSGGEQQRVAIAGALAMGQPLLVLDEAGAELDAAGSASLAQHLATLASAGTTVLAADHPGPILLRSERTLLLDGGAPVALDAPVAVVAHPSLAGPEPAPVSWDVASEVRAAGVEVRGVSFDYPGGTPALRDVTLAIEPGEAVAVVGGNGSGKSTLAKHLVGLLRPSGGSVAIDGRDLAASPVESIAGSVGVLLQDPRDQLFGRTVERAVAFGPRSLAYPRARAEALVAAALAATGLLDRRDTNPHDLDLAARKQAALAGVLAMDPALLVLDEPTTGQDPPGMRRLEAVIRALRDAGRTIVAITHDLELAARAFDRVVVMRAGEVIADGPSETTLGPANADILATTGLGPAALRHGRAN